MKVKLWDRKENINGINAEEIIKRREDIRKCEEVILIYDDLDENIVRQIEFPSVLKSNYNLQGTTALEIGQAYLSYLEECKKKEEETKLNQEKRMEALEQSNAELTTLIATMSTPTV